MAQPQGVAAGAGGLEGSPGRADVEAVSGVLEVLELSGF